MGLSSQHNNEENHIVGGQRVLIGVKPTKTAKYMGRHQLTD